MRADAHDSGRPGAASGDIRGEEEVDLTARSAPAALEGTEGAYAEASRVFHALAASVA